MSRDGAERIRPATSGDLDALAMLEREGFHPPWSTASLAAEIAKPTSRIWLAEPKGEVAAYACFQCLQAEAELLRIAVARTHRRHGLGRRLLHHALHTLTEEGVARCYLEVRADNVAALALYRALGFAPAAHPRRPGYYPGGTDALCLERVGFSVVGP